MSKNKERLEAHLQQDNKREYATVGVLVGLQRAERERKLATWKAAGKKARWQAGGFGGAGAMASREQKVG